MSVLSYLSVPYSGSGREMMVQRALMARAAAARLILGGRLVLCPVLMNHEILAQLAEEDADVTKGYWLELEQRLAPTCDEAVVVGLPGWERSRGVSREVALFAKAGKPVLWMADAGASPTPMTAAHIRLLLEPGQ